jgi:hypothetical protein
MARIREPGKDEREELPLSKAVEFLLEECRMVLPGIQALFGFQLIAVFNDGFGEKLTSAQQQLHFAALILVALSAGLVMAPAAVHRQSQQRAVSERFIWLSSWLLLLSMFPLAVGLSLDVYLIGRIVFEAEAASVAFAVVLFVFLMVLWLALPRRERKLNG